MAPEPLMEWVSHACAVETAGSRLTVSVIVPAFNTAQTLPRCIDALLNQTVRREAYEIIIVDDGSTDDTAEAADRRDVNLVRRNHAGPAAARNAGISRARGDLLLFTDADCEPTPNWIEAMVQPFADPKVMGCKGVYRTRQRGLLPRFVQVEYEEKYRSMEGVDSIDFIDTYSAAYRKSVFLAEGLFSEDILAAEDVEFSFRLAQRGHRLVFNPQAIVYHSHAQSLRHYLQRKFRFGRWRSWVYIRYPQKISGDSHTPKDLRWQMLLVAMTLVSLPLAWLLPWGAWLPVLVTMAFVILSLPFLVRAGKKDLAVMFVAPFFLWVRALALGLGLCYGLARHYAGRLWWCVSPQGHVR